MSATPPAESPAPATLPDRPISHWHGYAGNPAWAPPKCVCASKDIARPKYSGETASEYIDTKEVLAEKIGQLVQMIRSAQNFCVYTGAGLSTAAGIGDYASRASGSVVAKETGTNRLNLQPTHSHRVLAALEKAGFLKFWLQQNHDGLAQKAGFPLSKLNEIHGTWFDTKHNPVVLMDGHVRKDLHEWMIEWMHLADLAIAIGTSLCGMGADCVAEQTARRHKVEGLGFGLVIINLQSTPYDEHAALRIYAKADSVFAGVQAMMKLKIDTKLYEAHAPPMALEKLRKEREARKRTNEAHHAE